MRHLATGLLAAGLVAATVAPAAARDGGPYPAPQGDAPAAPNPVAHSREDAALAARLAGSTLRAEIWDGFLNQNHIHRFHPDGTVDGQFTARRTIRLGIDFVHEYDRGRWSVDGGRLCVTWRKFFLGRPQCYSLSPAGAARMRFANATGGPSYLGRIDPTE